jgi:hypothetical protein
MYQNEEMPVGIPTSPRAGEIVPDLIFRRKNPVKDRTPVPQDIGGVPHSPFR